jgi:hypothetical protein
VPFRLLNFLHAAPLDDEAGVVFSVLHCLAVRIPTKDAILHTCTHWRTHWHSGHPGSMAV